MLHNGSTEDHHDPRAPDDQPPPGGLDPAPSAATPPPPHRDPTRRARHPHGRETVVSVSIGHDPLDPLRPREMFPDAGHRSGADLEFVV